ncbi:MAG: hypothetical protein IPK07_07805 [Deltaproteobacteria bacterium]|nr:hypothetical protein [Deltaproteobacteria bacterium]
MTHLVVFRALQGLGAGAIMPITPFTIVGDLFTPRAARAAARSLQRDLGFSSVVKPVLGGYPDRPAPLALGVLRTRRRGSSRWRS